MFCRALIGLIWLFFVSAALAQQVPASSGVSQGTWAGMDLAKLHERFLISYFGELLGASMKKWDDNQINPQGQKTADPANMWHSFNILTKISGGTSLFISPRFFTQFGDRNDLPADHDQHVVVMDDWQFGFQQSWIKNSQFTWDSRLTHRAPMSVASKEEHIDSQTELLQVVTWKPIAQIFVYSQTDMRYYVYDRTVNEQRYRLNQMTAINWIFNDKWRIQAFQEFDMQHRAPKEGDGKKDANYFKKYKDYLAIGIGYSVSHGLTLMPFIKALNDTDIRPETMQYGMWAFGRVF